MKRPGTKPAIDSTAQQLRKLVLDTPPDTLIGNEQALVDRLGVSRATVRQVARLLEREGLLLVKRGINGGYFSARPDLGTIESSVTSYLEMLDTDVKETTVVGSALWVELLKLAASAPVEEAQALVHSFRGEIEAVQADATFDDILRLEQQLRAAIFKLVNSRYMELIFHINLIFSRRKFPSRPGDIDDTQYHRNFVRAWRSAKLIELDAIELGDEELAALSAKHSRKIWYDRIWKTEGPLLD